MVHAVSGKLNFAIDSAVKEMVSEKTAIAFSGGLDSGIVAAIAGKYSDITLYTVGAKDAYDVTASKELAEIMKLKWKHIEIKENELEEEMKEMIRITGTVNPITLSFEVPLFYVLKYASENTVLSGQGADELFAGYSKYVDLEKNELRDQMKADMLNLMEVTIKHEQSVAKEFGKTLKYPFLDQNVIDIVKTIDIEDLEPKDLRKHVLRDVATLIDQPEIALKPKKAAQYGSGTMSMIRAIAKKKRTTVNGLISQLSEGI